MSDKKIPEKAKEEKKTLTDSLLSEDMLKNISGGGNYGVQTHDAWCDVCQRVTRHNIQNWCIEHSW